MRFLNIIKIPIFIILTAFIFLLIIGNVEIINSFNFVTVSHVLSHILISIFIIYLFIRNNEKINIKQYFYLLFLGALSGIFPDLLGGHIPWTHSIIFSFIIILPIAIIARILVRKISFLKIWLALVLSEVVGHLFYDFLDHKIFLLYPLSQKQISFQIILNGDPWILVLLIIGLIFSLIRYKKKIGIIILIIIIVFMIGLRSYSNITLFNTLKNNYKLDETAVIEVYPPGNNLINIYNPFEWLQWGYDITAEQRVIRGFAPLIGKSFKNHVDVFFPQPSALVKETNGTYREPIPNEVRLEVVDAFEKNSGYYIIGKNNKEDQSVLYVFKKMANGRWKEIFGEEKQNFINYFRQK